MTDATIKPTPPQGPTPEEKAAQVKKPWNEQNTAAKYLRKLLVEHFGFNVEDVDAVWKDGLEPPLCESDMIIYS